MKVEVDSMTKNDNIKKKDLKDLMEKLYSGEYDVNLDTYYRGHHIKINLTFKNRTEYIQHYMKNNKRVSEQRKQKYHERILKGRCPKCNVKVNGKYKLCKKHRKN